MESKKEYAVMDRGRDNDYINQTLRALKVLSKNIRGSHSFSHEELERERQRLKELDEYYLNLEKLIEQAHKG